MAERPGLFARLRTAIARIIAPAGALVKRNAYAAADFTRLTADWVRAGWRSADQESRYELRTMRNRARELDRNSPWGQRYSQILAENIVGPYGIQLKPKNVLKDGSGLHVNANANIKDAWARWCKPGVCDVTKKLSFTELLALAVAQWGTDGEILIRKYRGTGFGGANGFAVQVLDPDYLDETLNQDRVGDAALIRQGVEFDKYGAPVAYHLWTTHPQDPTIYKERVRVPASDIIHAFIPKRAGQSRGVPHGAAIMTTVKMLDGYIEAELVAARVASSTMAAIEDQPNDDGFAPATNPSAAGTGDPSMGNAGSSIPMEVEPAAMLDLRGTRSRLAMWDPQHPTSAFPDFTRMMAHFVAMGFGLSYGTLTGDLSQANYGSLRVGMLDERDHWRRFQQFVIDHVVENVYDEWLKAAVLNNQIVGISDAESARWARRKWLPRGFDWIDPLKDVQGELIEVSAGANSITRMCAQRGYDLEEILEERAEEIALFEEYGVPCVLATTITDRPQETAQQESGDTTDAQAGNTSDGVKGFAPALPVVPITITTTNPQAAKARRRQRRTG